MSREEKVNKMRELVRNLNPFETRQWVESTRNKKVIMNQRKEVKSDKVVLMEFCNLHEIFMARMFHLNSVYYMSSCFEDFKQKSTDEEQSAVQKFMNDYYGMKKDHLGEIKQMMCDDTREIPELPEDFKTDLQMSYEQVDLSYQHFLQNYDNLRILTKGMYGIEPDFESMIYIHGVFTEPELEKYIQKETKSLDSAICDEAVVIPVGQTSLVQLFRENKEAVTMYN
ncbi:unnamed protein product, partial [Ascophyllum nodosum]